MVEETTIGSLGKGAAEHFQNMLSDVEGIEQTGRLAWGGLSEAGSRDAGSRWRGWERARWNSRCKSGEGDLQIAEGHLGFQVSEQFHHGGQTDASTESSLCRRNVAIGAGQSGS